MEDADNQIFTKPRMYSDVNYERPASYSCFDENEVNWQSPEDYNIVQRLGRGKYSDVFEAYVGATKEKCVIKVLKPVRKKKIGREIKILENLRGCPNIINFHKAIISSDKKFMSLVFEYVEATDWNQCMDECADADPRFYLREILKALDYCHSNGIIHRDLKPNNIVIDHKAKKLKLIDWGLAEFYFPGVQLNLKVASRYFKGPELLLGYYHYDYSLDLWAFGCIVASVIFRKDPFFPGKDNNDQLLLIVKTLGTDALMAYISKFNIIESGVLRECLGSCPKKNWNRFIHCGNRDLATEHAVSLIDKLLVMDHSARLTAKEAMDHSYFYGLLPLLNTTAF